jgi:hypothetical protein
VHPRCARSDPGSRASRIQLECIEHFRDCPSRRN